MSSAHDTRQVRHESGSEVLRKSPGDQVQIVLIIAAPSDRLASLPHTGEVRFSRGMSFAHDTLQVRHDSGSEVLRKTPNDQVQTVLIIAAPSDRVASPPLAGEARLDSGMSSRRGSHDNIGLQSHFQPHVAHLYSAPTSGEATRGFSESTRERRK